MPKPGPKPGSHNGQTRGGQNKKTQKGMTRKAFTLQEKAQIIELHDKGMKCSDIIEKHFPGRVPLSISSVYNQVGNLKVAEAL